MRFNDECFYVAKYLRTQHTSAVVAKKCGWSLSTVTRQLSHSVPPSQRRRASSTVRKRRVAQRRRDATRLALKTVKKRGDTGVYGNKIPLVVKRPANASAADVRRALFNETGVCVSKSTIRRDLIASGLVNRKRRKGPRRRVDDAKRRVEFCRDMLGKYGGGKPVDILFSDEKYADINDHGSRTQWVRRTEDVLPFERERFCPRLHVWGCIGIGVKILVFLPPIIAAVDYQKFCLKPNVAALRKGLFMQDNARPHVSSTTMSFFRRNKVSSRGLASTLPRHQRNRNVVGSH